MNKARKLARLTRKSRVEWRLSIGWMVIALSMATLLSTAAEVVRIPIKKKRAGPLFQIHYGQKWGYMDRSGKTVIPPQFDDEGDFFTDRARVRKGGKWGYIDGGGHLKVPFQFDAAGDFSEGLAPVQVGRRWGYIHLSGVMAVEPQFQAAAEFSDGVARIEVWDTISCDLMDYRKKGHEVFTKDNAPISIFRLRGFQLQRDGCFAENSRYGYIAKGGKVVIAPTFRVASDFSEGLAVVRGTGSQESKYGYIDKAGRITIEARFDQALDFSEGLAAVAIGTGTDNSQSWGFINRMGVVEIQPTFRSAGSFSEGLAHVSLRDRGVGYVERNGKFAIQPRYSEATPFLNGLALVWSVDEEVGFYINKAGTKALTLALSPQWSFSDGLTIAGTQGERKYVDRRGHIVAPYEVDPGYDD